MKRFILAAIACVLPTIAAAEFTSLNDKAKFLSLVDGKVLSHGFFGIELRVSPDGTIDGQAQGWPVTGTWRWQDGFFCRELDWDGYAIPYNCQLVEVRGGDELRFTVDRGEGRSARFRLR